MRLLEMLRSFEFGAEFCLKTAVVICIHIFTVRYMSKFGIAGADVFHRVVRLFLIAKSKNAATNWRTECSRPKHFPSSMFFLLVCF